MSADADADSGTDAAGEQPAARAAHAAPGAREDSGARRGTEGAPASPPAGIDVVFDKGLQPERTLLAWRRTCLAFGIASLVGMRFSVGSMGILAVVIGVIGAGLAVLAYALAATGYRRAHVGLRAQGILARGGLPMLAGTAAVLVIGVLCAGRLAGDLLGA